MNEIRQFRQNGQIVNGITAETNLKMFDIIPAQHENLATNTNKQVKISIAQALCEPVAVCSTNNPQNGQYTATCVNFPDFAVSFVDSNSVRHNLIGLKLRVIFEHGITYGSVASGTFPTLSINGSEALPLLAQGKTMAQGAIVAGQSVEFTIIPYGNSIAFDADSNVRENTNDYTIYTDGFGRTNSVEVNNLQSVTSNAVYSTCLNEDTQVYTTPYKNGVITVSKIGKFVYLQASGDWVNLPNGQQITIFGLPSKYYPKYSGVALKEQTSENIALFVQTDGTVSVYNYNSYTAHANNGQYLGCWITN